MKQYTHSEKLFNEYMIRGPQVKVIELKPGFPEKKKIKVGAKKIHNYTGGHVEISGQMVYDPYLKDNPTYEDQYEERSYPTKEVTWEFLSEKDEKDFDDYLASLKAADGIG